MAKKGQRGGRRQRRYATKDHLGVIDCVALSDLLKSLAPNARPEQHEFALQIVVKGIERHRENAPSGPRLAQPVQKSRRALKKFIEGNRGTEMAPFNGLIEFDGKLYGTSSDGLYELQDVAAPDLFDPYEGIDKAIADPFRLFATIHQCAAGFTHINPNVPFNPVSEVGEDGAVRTVAEVVLDNLASPKDFDAELAGYSHLALSLGLSVEVSHSWYEEEPKKMGAGWNLGRLLILAATQAGLMLPSGRDGMEGLMKRGKKCADQMLEPAITFADGRSLSDFQIEFSEAGDE